MAAVADVMASDRGGNASANCAKPETVVADPAPVRPWALAWVGGAGLGIVNGSLRDLTYGKSLGDRTAHQVSTGTLIVLLMLYMHGLQRRWPIGSRRVALRIGGTWTFLTVLFEFGFGHLVAGKSWRTLLEDYDVTKGRLWSLVLASLAAGPLVTSRVNGNRPRPPRPKVPTLGVRTAVSGHPRG